jgi:hypothetical protein
MCEDLFDCIHESETTTGDEMARKKKVRVNPPKVLWALWDGEDEMYGFGYFTEKEAVEDAVGPRFRPRYTLRAYQLMTRVEEKTLKPV